MAAERPKIAKGMPVSRANVVKNELRNYGKPFCPAFFIMVGHDCIYGGVSRRRVVSARDRGVFLIQYGS